MTKLEGTFYDIPIDCGFIGFRHCDVTFFAGKIFKVDLIITSGVKVNVTLSLDDEKCEWIRQAVQASEEKRKAE